MLRGTPKSIGVDMHLFPVNPWGAWQVVLLCHERLLLSTTPTKDDNDLTVI